MGAADVVMLAGQFGPMGLMVGYLVWDRHAERKHLTDNEDKNRELSRERIRADLEMARSLALLTAMIQGNK